ncbi:MAG: hypothetical protein QXG52_07300 [Candidatus Caldarchaeum sp.]
MSIVAVNESLQKNGELIFSLKRYTFPKRLNAVPDVTVAVQVLGPTKYSPIRFVFYDGKIEVESRFCSTAIAEKEGGEAVFLAPESLSASLAEHVDDCCELFRNRERLVQRIHEKILQDEKAEVVLVPSIGVYQGKDRFPIVFAGDFATVEAFMFIFFVRQIRQNKKSFLMFQPG